MKLRQSFLRVATRARREVGRLLNTRGHKQGLRWIGKMRTWLGRLIRDIGRKIAGNEALEAAFETALERAGRILGQKPGDKGKLYALHAPEVECIGKGTRRALNDKDCVRRFQQTDYAARSWRKERRVIARVEANRRRTPRSS